MNNKLLQCESDVEKILQDQKEMLKKYGWYSHYVVDDENNIDSINTHTHGFKESLNHLNFQIVLYLEPLDSSIKLCSSTFKEFYERIKNGERFEDNLNNNIHVNTHTVRLIKIDDEQDGKILRIIFPDENGLFPGDEGCNYKYEKQLTQPSVN